MTPIAYSILELAIVSKGESLKKTFDNTLQLAELAENIGYTRFWLAEHHNAENIGSSATSVLIGYIAQGTKTIRVGSGGIMLPNHSPLIIAEQFGTLGILFPNRIDLGLGRAPGTDRETAQAIRSDFMMAAHSFPEEVKKIEQYFSKANSTSKIRATVAEGVHVPLYILGSSTDSAHLAAQKGLPYAFASHFATAHLFEALKIYQEKFQPSETLSKPYTMAGVNIIIAETDEAAERMSTSLLRMIIGIFTGKREPLQAPTEMTAELKELSQHPSVHQMLKYSFIGSKKTVKAQVKKFLEQTNVDELIAVSHMYNADDRLKSYQWFAEIMQELNAEAT
ncbi:MAG TPA: LLM class flavin-dependent oxidoreductase [Aquaticitalea sp.]|nr:LLM class flavin-dependent oxidoreductase [Aquaticitalea sp.]